MTPRAERPRPAPGERLYRALLRAYPPSFRRRYSADMLAFYRERLDASAGTKITRLIRVWSQLVPDLLASALAERFAPLRRDVESAPASIRVYSIRREDTMSILGQDLRYAARSMARHPGFTAVVLATLALGIGANAAIFTVVNAVLLRPLPFAHQERIVDFTHEDPYTNVSEPEFLDYQRGVSALAKLAAYNSSHVTIAAGSGEPSRTMSTRVSRDFFDVLGMQPELGRTFSSDEFSPISKVRPVVISHRLWMQEYGADPRIIGRTLTVNAARGTIVGVMPASFVFPDGETTFWTAWRMNPDSLWGRNNHYLRMVGALDARASIEQARAQARTLDQRWMHDFPETYMPAKPLVASILPLREFMLGPTRPYLIALLGAVGFILLIACVNVANLLLVRGEGRRKEFAIRTALGASGSRMVRQLFTESMLLAVFGAALGLILAWFGLRGLIGVAPSDLPRLEQVGVDARVIAFTVAITLLTGLLFGLVPAMRGFRGDSADTLRAGGKTSVQGVSGVARRALVVSEVALAVIMLTGAGLLIRSLIKLQATSLGFDPANVLTMQVTLPAGKYTDTTADEYVRQTVASVRRLPGVRSAAAVGALPITGDDSFWSIMIDGRVIKTVAEAPGAKPEQATPDFFTTMGIPLVRGRMFTEQDRLGGLPVAIISEGMAKKLWPGVDPVGHTLRMFSDPSPWVTIVGVVRDVGSRGFQSAIPETMYFPYSQSGSSAYSMPKTVTIVARTSGDPGALVASVRTAVRALDATVAISHVATMDQVVGNSIASRRFTTVLLAGFAGLALILAGIGIYGVISYGVSQRTYEIGVRMAMGASPVSILRLVMREGANLTAIGLLIGIAGALAVGRLLGSMLVGVTASDALTLSTVCCALALVAACACALPARRATNVSPTEALRTG
jgi:putative ABC transport system permease protein